MKVLKIALALAIAAISSFTAHAKNDPTTAYMFGFASSFSDSTVYMTSVQRVDSVYLTHKKLFLDNRENYSLQLKEYLEIEEVVQGTVWEAHFPEPLNGEEREQVQEIDEVMLYHELFH